MERPIIVKGEKVSLGLILKEDIQKLWLWINNREVRRYLASPDNIFFFEDELEWYERLRKNKDKNRVFAVIENKSESIVGVIGIHRIDHKNGHAEIGYFLGKEFWGRGYMSEAVKLALEYCFKWLNLRKVYAHVYGFNIASQKVLEKNGFKLVGKWKKHIYTPDGYTDLLCYEIFKEEWKG